MDFAKETLSLLPFLFTTYLVLEAVEARAGGLLERSLERTRAVGPLAGALAGAIAYAFCGFALFGVVRHPFFGNALVYLPLLLLGAERIMNRESPVLFMCMVAVAAASNIYFFYNIVLATVIYAVIRIVMMHWRTPRTGSTSTSAPRCRRRAASTPAWWACERRAAHP